MMKIGRHENSANIQISICSHRHQKLLSSRVDTINLKQGSHMTFCQGVQVLQQRSHTLYKKYYGKMWDEVPSEVPLVKMKRFGSLQDL